MAYTGAMLISTTPVLDGRKVVQYLGLVSGEAILGANVFRDMFASIRDTSAAARPGTSGSCARPRTSRSRR